MQGIGRALAKRIVALRSEEGRFRSREDLLRVHGLGKKTFQQVRARSTTSCPCHAPEASGADASQSTRPRRVSPLRDGVQAAAFVRVYGGVVALDSTAVHPESYGLVRSFADEYMDSTNLKGPNGAQGAVGDAAWLRRLGERAAELAGQSDAIALRFGIGEPTVRDVLAELAAPSRDPRAALPAVAMRRGAVRAEDVRAGDELSGTVRNVVPFGAFVDVGVGNDGLVHVSEMSESHVTSPHDLVCAMSAGTLARSLARSLLWERAEKGGFRL
jgi:uncharacterized protein